MGKYKYPMDMLDDQDNINFHFKVKVMKYAYVTLSPVAHDTTNQYEIAIGNSEQANTLAIRRCRQCDDEKSITTRYRLLEANEYKEFWVKLKSGRLEFGHFNGTILLSWTDMYAFDTRYVGIATGAGLSGDFVFCNNKQAITNTNSMEGIFGLFAFFLLPILMFLRFLWRKISRQLFKNLDDTASIDNFIATRGIHNQTMSLELDPPSYEKCMEGGRNERSTEEGTSSSDTEPPPSYESVMAKYLIISDEQYDFKQNRHTGITSSSDVETYI
ncbi:uncharacterized protein [Antedon mediterranea]